MLSNNNPSIAVVGAAGFVGQALLRQLHECGIMATAVVRGMPELFVDGDLHVACSPSEVAGDSFDIVVNLAYPTSGPGYEHPELNLEIARTVRGMVKQGGRLIQASTLAVFGLTLDRPVSVGPVSEAHDNVYVESKIAAERLFMRQQAECGLSLDIVRLGNIWGYASGTWAVPVVQRLITGGPVGIAGVVGHSNTTDVANVASYLVFLIQDGADDIGVRYHHLAEFSGVSWNAWTDPIAAALGVEPVYADSSALDGPASGIQEVSEAFRMVKPRRLYQRLSEERIAGSWTRALVRHLPKPLKAYLKSSGAVVAAYPRYDRADHAFLAIMAGRQEFKSAVHPKWTPPLSKEQSLDSVLKWLDRD
jgi:nucleoside-diphosphate-sugar epimerase